MKTRLAVIIILTTGIFAGLNGQELLVGGDMENESAWKIINYKPEAADYTFNVEGDGPSEGKGGYLRVTCTGTQETDIIFYQAVTLIGGTEYEFTGAFKDIGGGINNFWCEALYDTVEPPPADSGDFGGRLIVGFNTWDGTQPGVDGTFQNDFAKGTTNIFTAPGDSGTQITVYLVIDVGVWTGGTPYNYDVAIDELSLKPVGSTSVAKSNGNVIQRYSLYQNYPNPFNPQTTISFSLLQPNTVTLKVYDVMGRALATLVNNEKRSAGVHTVPFNAIHLPSGVYFYTLRVQGLSKTKRMLLLK